MKATRIALLTAALALAAGGAVQAQVKGDFGKSEYDANCASCHGPKGKGDGPWPFATKGSPKVADLTTLSRRNGGNFPFQRVYETIDGTLIVPAHGTTDMPVWGQRYRAVGGEAYFDMAYDPEAYVRTRILALADYLNRLQAK